MIQCADRKCRGSPTGLLRHVCAAGSLVVRMMAVLAALLLVADGAGAMRADTAGASPGIVMVICSDGVAKTVVLDAGGNPVETSGKEEACSGDGPCCTLVDGYALFPLAQAAAAWAPVATVAFFHSEPVGLRSGLWHGPQVRGPPSKDNA